jgi:hypothetical protein
MDEQNSEKDTPEKNDPARLVTDLDDKVNDAEKQDRASQRNSGQTDYCIWGLPWPQFVSATIAFLAVTVGIATAGLRWYADMISQDLIRQKARARINLSEMQRDADSADLSFSLIFKNVGETTALKTYGAWLQGECQHTSFQECIAWCLPYLREAQVKSYGPILSQREHTEEFFSTLKTGKARKKQRPVYFCGYVAYTDVFCMWHRQFYVASYNPVTDDLSSYTLSTEETEQQKCSP